MQPIASVRLTLEFDVLGTTPPDLTNIDDSRFDEAFDDEFLEDIRVAFTVRIAKHLGMDFVELP